MTLTKTKLGIPAFDNECGGVYFNRPALLAGPHGSGKLFTALRFTIARVKSGERVVIFTGRKPEDIILSAHALDFDFDSAIGSGQLLIVPYRGMVGRDGLLPFDAAIDELRKITAERNIGFAVFDDILPWVAVTPPEGAPARCEKFFSTLESLSLTALALIPAAVSPAAKALAEAAENVCNIVLRFGKASDGTRTFSVVKYNGMQIGKEALEFVVDDSPARTVKASDFTAQQEEPRRKITALFATDFTDTTPEALVSELPAPAAKPKTQPPVRNDGIRFDTAVQSAKAAQKPETDSAGRGAPRPRFSDIIK